MGETAARNVTLSGLELFDSLYQDCKYLTANVFLKQHSLTVKPFDTHITETRLRKWSYRK